MVVEIVELENPLVRKAKILRLRTSKLQDAFNASNATLTKQFLIDVEHDLSELESDSLDGLNDIEYTNITGIIANSRESVKTVNAAFSLATGIVSQSSAGSNTGHEAESFEFEDVKIRFKPFQFNGDIKEWRAFWDRFNVQIHSRRRLSAITKFTFLLECLRGTALEIIKGLAVTENNYEVSVARLFERFENPERLVSAYYDELREIKFSSIASEQRFNYDAIQKILKNLQSVGVTIDQDYLRTILMSKFSRDTLRGALKEVKRKEDSTFIVSDLMIAIDFTLKLEEAIDIAHKGMVESKSSSNFKTTTGALVGGSRNQNQKHTSKPKSQSSSGQPRKTKECVFCGYQNHNSHQCLRFNTLSRRRSLVIRKGLCFICLTGDHKIENCTKKDHKCPHCGRIGHGLGLCVANMIKNESRKKDAELKSSETTHSSSTGSSQGTFLQTFICKVRKPGVANSYLEIRGVLDPGSLKSYVHENIFRSLKLGSEEKNILSCFHFGSSDSTEIETNKVKLDLVTEKGISRTFAFDTSPCITGEFRSCPSSSIVSSILPSNFKYADPDIFESDQRPIEMLIGSNLYYNLVDITNVRILKSGIVLLNSQFGWVPSGCLCSDSCQTSVLINGSSLETNVDKENSDLDQSDIFDQSDLSDLKRLWVLEMLGIKSSEEEIEHDKVIENFRKTARISRKRFNTCWPWKHTKPELNSNYRIARARLRALISSSKSPMLESYRKVFEEYLEKGIIELAPKNTRYLIHYLPHRGIYQNNKLRIVFDASAKTKNGRSLNDLIFKGPPLQENILQLLMNFRLHAIGITSDIEKAFLQVELNEVDRDSVRFLWVKDITKPIEGDNVIHYRFARVPFGVNASPFLLNMVLQEHLSSTPNNEWHLMAQKKFYVDNLVVSVKDTQSAFHVFRSLFSKLEEISMNLRDWASNDNDFINSLPENLINKKEGLISILGLLWNRELDFFSVKLNTNSSIEATKRNILKFLASIFDPLGFFAPSTLKLKVFLQQCWKKKFDWSEYLPSHLEAEWNKIYSALVDIPKYTIPRRYWKFNGNGQISLHVFCDASKLAYACCAYLVYFDPSTCESASSLILAKVRTAPIKVITIPRLELLGVLIGKRTAVFIRENLDVNLHEIVLWTDATTVLQWLNTTSILPQFVHNRIVEIKHTPGITVRHTSGKQNPADLATRGEMPKELINNKLWWNGPIWITCKNIWPAPPQNSETYSNLHCDKTGILLGAFTSHSLLTSNIENKFSSWRARVRIFCHIIRFCIVRTNISLPLTDTELYQKAERLLIRELQKKYYGKEYKLALKAKTDYTDKGLTPPDALRSITSLDLFMDQNFLLRCKGRLQNVSFPWDTIHPILLPKDSLATRSYIKELHVSNHHIGCSHLLSKIREKFWVAKGRNLIKSVIHNCVDCKKWSGGSYQLPTMPPLPLERVEQASPFLNVGIDYLGPIYIDSMNTPTQVYVVIFVCLVTRAIHLEIARDTKAIEFLRTFSRFVNIRGSPKFVVTDNAANFTFIQPFVGEKVNFNDQGISRYCNDKNIIWKFIPQYSPWQGGAYERMIALVKNCLRKSYGILLLDYVDLLTALYSIADTINSRPLTYVSSDEILTPLTPNHFLRLRTNYANSNLIVRNIRTDSTGQKVRDLWEHITGVVENFWSVFHKHYLTSLRERHVKTHKLVKGSLPLIPKVNDEVLVRELGAPRSQWHLGKILRLDHRRAVAQVLCNGNELTRSIKFLYPIELSDSH